MLLLLSIFLSPISAILVQENHPYSTLNVSEGATISSVYWTRKVLKEIKIFEN